MAKNPHNKSAQELHEYWRNPGGNNQPQRYLNKEKRSAYLYQYVTKYAEPHWSIMEPGCNVGRNLNYLYENGYKNLTGIEINGDAINLLNKHFPEMGRHIQIHHSPLEDTISKFKDDEFDLVFSMAVLEHIHSESEWVLHDIARITRSYLIVIESENWISDRHFPRDYKTLYESLGFQQTEVDEDLTNDGFGRDYICRVFNKK